MKKSGTLRPYAAIRRLRLENVQGLKSREKWTKQQTKKKKFMFKK